MVRSHCQFHSPRIPPNPMDCGDRPVNGTNSSVRFLLFLIALVISGAAADAQPVSATAPVSQEQTHRSQVMGSPRAFRVFLPPSYSTARTTRFPVIYWFHGYEPENETRDAALSAYVAAHPVILIDSGPTDTTGQFPLYFPELIEYVDKTFRTVPDRDHRAATGFRRRRFSRHLAGRQMPRPHRERFEFRRACRSRDRPPGFRSRFRPHRSLLNAGPSAHPPGGCEFRGLPRPSTFTSTPSLIHLPSRPRSATWTPTPISPSGIGKWCPTAAVPLLPCWKMYPAPGSVPPCGNGFPVALSSPRLSSPSPRRACTRLPLSTP